MPKSSFDSQVNGYETVSTLKQRGWTDVAIARFLGQPDITRPMPAGARTRKPLFYYDPDRVAAVEALPEVHDWLIDSARKRGLDPGSVVISRAEFLRRCDETAYSSDSTDDQKPAKLALSNWVSTVPIEFNATPDNDPTFDDLFGVAYTKFVAEFESKARELKVENRFREILRQTLRKRIINGIIATYPWLEDVAQKDVWIE